MSAPAAFEGLTHEGIRTALSTRHLGRAFHLLEETDSTNTVAFAMAQAGAPHGAVVVAERQTAGRGRLGRSWYSPAGRNLYCSIILRFGGHSERVPFWLMWTPLISAVAAARAVQVTSGLRPALKWPNDIMIGSRKLGGLLCESTAGASGGFIVVGIGLNINIRPEEFPEELQQIATSMCAESGRSYDRAVLLAALLSELETRYDALLSDQPSHVLSEYAMKCSTLGRRVQVTLASGECVVGLAESLGPDGTLRVVREASPDGPQGPSVLTIRAGDVIHLR